MPGAYQIDVPNGVVFIRLWGVLTVELLGDMRRALVGDPRFNPEYPLLQDLRGVTEVALPHATLTGEDSQGRLTTGPRRALVVDDPVMSVVIKMAGALGNVDPKRFLLTRTVPEARRWLGLNMDDPWPDEHQIIRTESPS